MQNPTVLYEDKDLLVVNKPSGLLVHPFVKPKAKSQKSKVLDEPTLTDWLLRHYPEVKTVGDAPEERPGIIHRLDRDTSGVMVVARNQKTFLYLKSLFQKHEVKKTYLALVWGVSKETTGTITKPIGIRNGTVKRSVHGGRMIKDAVTDYRVLRTYVDVRGRDYDSLRMSLLKVSPQTGRTHQIRVHLASIHHPIVGDPLYGKKHESFAAPRLMLHASEIEFAKSDGKRIRVAAEPPQDFLDYEKTVGP